MGSATIRVGSVEILSVADAVAYLRPSPARIVPEVPEAAWEPYRRRYPEAYAEDGRWRAVVGSFLLHSGGRTVLVDTGIGPFGFSLMGDAEGRLLDELRAHGFEPAAIDTVFLTHIHPDHIGWNVLPDGTPAFANARYLIQRADWEAAHAPEAAGRQPSVGRSLTPLEGLGCLDLLDGETPVTPELIALPTPGHTPGHMSLLIASGGETAVITGDVVANPAQVSEPDWMPVFDEDRPGAAATRRALLERIEAEGMTVAAGHFPPPGFGRIVRLEGRRYWQALGDDGAG